MISQFLVTMKHFSLEGQILELFGNALNLALFQSPAAMTEFCTLGVGPKVIFSGNCARLGERNMVMETAIFSGTFVRNVLI